MKDWTKAVLLIGVLLVGGIYFGVLKFEPQSAALPGAPTVSATGSCPSNPSIGVTNKNALQDGNYATNDINESIINNVAQGDISLTGGTGSKSNLSIGDNFTLYLADNGTGNYKYYGGKVEGTVNQCGTQNVSIKSPMMGSLTMYVNNPTTNATTRNAASATEDIDAGEIVTINVCSEQSIAYGNFGTTGQSVLVGDYNRTQYPEITTSYPLSTINTAHVQQTGGADNNSDSSIAWSIPENFSGIGKSLCVPVSIKASSTINPYSDINFWFQDISISENPNTGTWQYGAVNYLGNDIGLPEGTTAGTNTISFYVTRDN